MNHWEYKKQMSVSTKYQNISVPGAQGPKGFQGPPGSSPSWTRAIVITECQNNRTVKVVEVTNPNSGELFSHDVTVTKERGGPEVVFTNLLLGPALECHFRLVTKYGGVAKPKTPKQIEKEKHAVLDELIEALDSPSVDFGRKQAALEQKPTPSPMFKSDEELKVRPRDSDFNILSLDYQNSVVDVFKALGWDSSVAGRQSVAMSLGYRGKLVSDDHKRSTMNAWLVQEVNRRFGYELNDRVRKAKLKNFEPVFTPLDWDEHMAELEGQEVSLKVQEILDTKLLSIQSLKKTPMVKNNRGVYEKLQKLEKETIAESTKIKKSKARTLKDQVLDAAIMHVREVQDLLVDEVGDIELRKELKDHIENHNDGCWHIDTEDLHDILDSFSYWE